VILLCVLRNKFLTPASGEKILHNWGFYYCKKQWR
jgi:hypothetical protein